MRFPLLAALISALLVVGCDLYIFFDILSVLRRRRTLWSVIYGIFTLCCWALVVMILVYPKADPEVTLVPLMWMLFAAMAVYIPKVIYVIFSLLGRLFGIPRKLRGSRKVGRITGIALAGILLIFMLWGAFVTSNSIIVNHVDVVSDRLPRSFNGMKVLQFSDAHLGTWGNDTTFIAKMVDSINAQNPDLVLFTGDIVSRRSAELDPFTGVLGRIRAKHGVYAIHGNHDYASYVKWSDPGRENRDVARLDSLMRSMNWRVLNNAMDFIKAGNDSIAVIGVENWGEPPFKQLGDLHASFPGMRGDEIGPYDKNFKILLTHNPNHWSQVVRHTSNIDLTLSGHTHAMQIMLGKGKHKWSPSQYRYDQWGGMYDDTAKDGTPVHLYVNIGIGEVGYPVRMGSANPELTVFTLKSGK